MFNSSELEGEVDHSFFDSDGDDVSISRGGGDKSERTPADERLRGKQTEKTKENLSPRTDGTKKHPEQGNNNRSRVERKERSYQTKEEERRRASIRTSASSTSDKGISSSSDSEEDYHLRSKRPDKTFMALLVETRGVHDEDEYSPSPNETEEDEEALPSTAKNTKRRNKQSPKKLTRNWRTRSPSPTSTDPDSESCSSSGGLGSPTLPKPTKSSLFPTDRRSRVGSRDSPTSRTEESDDTVTDVSPLSSPDISPLQSLDLNHTVAKEQQLQQPRQEQERQHQQPRQEQERQHQQPRQEQERQHQQPRQEQEQERQQQQQQQHEQERQQPRQEQQQEQESVPSSGLSYIHPDENSDQDVDEFSLGSESQFRFKQVVHFPGQKNRKNFSFSNDEVRRIDLENQRLLRSLSRLSAESTPERAVKKKTNKAGNSPVARVTHSAVNRQREQKRIDRENMAFLKRLESVKPSNGMRRTEQLAEYHRRSTHYGGPVYPASQSTSKKVRWTDSSSRSVGSTHHSSRAASTTTTTTTESSGSPGPRSKQPGAVAKKPVAAYV